MYLDLLSKDQGKKPEQTKKYLVCNNLLSRATVWLQKLQKRYSM